MTFKQTFNEQAVAYAHFHFHCLSVKQRLQIKDFLLIIDWLSWF